MLETQNLKLLSLIKSIMCWKEEKTSCRTWNISQQTRNPESHWAWGDFCTLRWTFVATASAHLRTWYKSQGIKNNNSILSKINFFFLLQDTGKKEHWVCGQFRAWILFLPCLLGNRDDILPLEMRTKAVVQSDHHAIITDRGSWDYRSVCSYKYSAGTPLGFRASAGLLLSPWELN